MLGVTRLKLRVSCDAPFFNVALETADRVLRRAHALHLLTRTVCGTRVRHAIFFSFFFVIRNQARDREKHGVRTNVHHSGK